LKRLSGALVLCALIAGFAFPSTAAGGPARQFMLMQGSETATAVHLLDSGRAGPVALVIAGIHGDEVAGMAAAKRLIATRPGRGKIIVLPVANRLAADSAVRAPYYMQDLNRAFPGKKTGNTTEMLAAALMGVIERYRPAIVIDLHEANSRAAPEIGETANSLILSDDGRAAKIALPVLEALAEGGETRFTFLSGAPKGSLNREVSTRLGIPVITIETDTLDDLEHRTQTQLSIIRLILENIETARQ
jgi:predicted deacylase